MGARIFPCGRQKQKSSVETLITMIMDKGTDFFVKDTGMLRSKIVVNSSCIKHSKWELAWRIGVTVAVIASIAMHVL